MNDGTHWDQAIGKMGARDMRVSSLLLTSAVLLRRQSATL